MADYDFGSLATPVKKAYDFGSLASPKNDVKKDAPLADQIPGSEYAIEWQKKNAAASPEKSMLDKAKGIGETALAAGTGAVAGAAGQIAGGLDVLTNGKYGTQEGVRHAADAASNYADRLTYQPRTATGKEYTEKFGDAIQQSGIAGVPIAEGAQLGRARMLSKPATDALTSNAAKTVSRAISDSPEADYVRRGAQALGNTVKPLTNLIPDLPKRNTGLSGVGAALTPEGTLRTERSQALPIPIDLTKGQKSRTHEQQKFEKETAKAEEGEPLRQRFADQNEKILQNLDVFDDMTGAQERSLRAVGKVVNDSLVEKKNRAKTSINTAYDAAKKSGAMSQMIDIAPLNDYIKNNWSASKNAPVIAAVKSEINRIGKGKSQLSISDLEEIRKTIGKVSSSPADFNFGPEMRQLIDASTDGKGGAKYQQARRMYENYAKEFKNKAVIAKLISSKKGTTDRSVAYEDVFNHAIMNGSLDDVRNVRRTLQTAGEKGQQAWKELQGQGIRNIKDSITANVSRDIRGNPIVSPAALDKLVVEMDKDGKLDFLYGKKGAQQIRDLNDIAKDVYTSPPGSVNHSNTASILIGLLDTAVSGMAGVPLPIGSALNYGVKKVKSNALKKRVTDALDSGPISSPPTNP